MIDLSEPTLHKYRRKVLEIYRELERNPWAPLGIFESKLRKINILNSKIKNVSSDIGKPEGEYSNFTKDNYMGSDSLAAKLIPMEEKFTVAYNTLDLAITNYHKELNLNTENNLVL